MKNMSYLFDKYLDNGTNTLIDPVGVKYLSYMLNDDWIEDTVGNPKFLLNEAAFEWLSLLDAIDQSIDNFVFVELGAGYGKWSARAYNACLRNNIKKIKLLLVEGEPQHAAWARQHLTYNDIPENSFVVKEGLISTYNGKGQIIVHDGNGLNGIKTPKTWYGQCQVPEARKEDILSKDFYLGKELLVDKHGMGRVVCDTYTIESLLADEDVVDVLNLDIQGLELVVIQNGLDVINKKIKNLYVSTHSQEIDRDLYELMKNAGWINVHAFPCNSMSKTELGDIQFGDGVSSWKNPFYN